MEGKEIANEAEAQEVLARLEHFYKEPVLPLGRFCAAIELWMDCVIRNNTEPELSGKGRARYLRQPYFKHLNRIRIDIRKSNLLGRLLFAKEQLRTRMCPVHRGHWDGHAMFFEKCPHLCDGTGWLRERQSDGGYTGVTIRLVNNPFEP